MDEACRIEMLLVNYTDSGFTNAHECFTHVEPTDRRGTFSHVGVCMDGLESRRHLNFSADENNSRPVFKRDFKTRNAVELKITGPKNTDRFKITRIILNTAYFTKNQTKFVYNVKAIDDKTGKESTILENIKLKGDVKDATFDIPEEKQAIASRIRLSLSEGGLCRFIVFGIPQPRSAPLPPNLLKDAKPFVCSDSSYGDPTCVLREAREGTVMAGWETRRHSFRQRLGITLAKPITEITSVQVDTYRHTLNSFKWIIILGTCQPDATTEDLLDNLPSWKVVFEGQEERIIPDNDVDRTLGGYEKENFDGSISYSLNFGSGENEKAKWHEVLPFTQLKPDALHEFKSGDLRNLKLPFTHLIVYGIPDGGVHRIGIYGS
eukprot:TRINITY_DN17797_c0_g1_i1.p1 TRINITY_DN17797_c0_g1~~TRINITY_DN17797_c0_g1_i1.p1  ORF type:complete len:378 (-),score=63.26 TRINITY_DN17797_c0_g1_i1:67-1200(-)